MASQFSAPPSSLSVCATALTRPQLRRRKSNEIKAQCHSALTLASTNTGSLTLGIATVGATPGVPASRSNTYSGGTNINGGALYVATGNLYSVSGLQHSGTGTGPVTVNNGGTLVGGTIGLNGVGPSLKSVQFSGTTSGYTINRGNTGSAAITLKADVGDAAIIASGTQDHCISAPIVSLSNLDVAQTGAASLTLGDVTTSSGTTLHIDGTIAAGAIGGGGTTSVAGTLTADSIVQDALVISAGGTVVIRETSSGATAVPEPGVFASLTTGAVLLFLARQRRFSTDS